MSSTTIFNVDGVPTLDVTRLADGRYYLKAGRRLWWAYSYETEDAALAVARRLVDDWDTEEGEYETDLRVNFVRDHERVVRSSL